jgi:hypothetical protein
MKKTMLILTAFIFVQFCTAFISSGKPLPAHEKVNVPPSFSFLRVHETGTGYNLQWKLNSNSAVQSFIIECTYEDAFDPYSVWQMRGRVNPGPGVDMFKDNNLLPGIINYRITAVSNNNTTLAVSDILTFTVE